MNQPWLQVVQIHTLRLVHCTGISEWSSDGIWSEPDSAGWYRLSEQVLLIVGDLVVPKPQLGQVSHLRQRRDIGDLVVLEAQLGQSCRIFEAREIGDRL